MKSASTRKSATEKRDTPKPVVVGKFLLNEITACVAIRRRTRRNAAAAAALRHHYLCYWFMLISLSFRPRPPNEVQIGTETDLLGLPRAVSDEWKHTYIKLSITIPLVRDGTVCPRLLILYPAMGGKLGIQNKCVGCVKSITSNFQYNLQFIYC